MTTYILTDNHTLLHYNEYLMIRSLASTMYVVVCMYMYIYLCISCKWWARICTIGLVQYSHAQYCAAYLHTETCRCSSNGMGRVRVGSCLFIVQHQSYTIHVHMPTTYHINQIRIKSTMYPLTTHLNSSFDMSESSCKSLSRSSGTHHSILPVVGFTLE